MKVLMLGAGEETLSPIFLLTEKFVYPSSRSSPFAFTQTQTTLRPCEPTKVKQFTFDERFSLSTSSVEN